MTDKRKRLSNRTKMEMITENDRRGLRKLAEKFNVGKTK